MNLSKRELVLTGLIVLLLAVNISLISRKEDTKSSNIDSHDMDTYFAPEEDFYKAEIVVHITGQVKNCGVICIPEGARIVDAINAAGGACEDADIDRINLARALHDGEKLYIPAFGETMDNDEILGYNVQVNAKVNINTADTAQLETLTGIGPVLAGRIVDFREKEGRFQKPEDLMKVSGIGTKTYDSLKDCITVR